ncbi:hypothetical protein HIM_09471 [Hirsutella minnesotensis 3608]|uniref:Uncharacterized protein n=1 Tax=Hirsutella minnesotensis 3608 TaxID=1043627 RepID=A0A0F7ZXQ2_9HYPO|nr:hypothetical protein HIM_09471 [Hirsutella minnesotensis 3608]
MAPVTRKRSHDQVATDTPVAKAVSEKRARAGPKTGKAHKKQSKDAVASGEAFIVGNKLPSTKSARSVKETKADMRKRATDMEKLLERDLKREMSTQHQQSDAGGLSVELAQVLNLADTSGRSIGGKQNETFERATQCLTGFQNLVKGYQDLNQGGSKWEQPTWLHWDEDKANLEDLTESAKGAAFRILDSIIMPYASGDLTEDRDGATLRRDINDVASEILEDAKPMPGEQTYGTMARDFLEALAKVVELLPEAEQAHTGTGK